MNALLALTALVLSIGIAFFIPKAGGPAVVFCAAMALLAGVAISQVKEHREFLLQLFVAGLIVRMAVGTLIYFFRMQEFFGGDANTYDEVGYLLLKVWQGDLHLTTYKTIIGPFLSKNWGMIYIVAGIYALVERNMLAIQFFNAVIGAATATIVFLCARQIFQNLRVARFAAFFVAFYPSLVLWSSQGLKDGPIVFLLALTMLATLKLGERFSGKYFAMLVCALSGLLTLRFYIFYMALAAVVGAFAIGMRQHTTQNFMRQFVIIIGMGLALTYLGVLRTAGGQLELYGDLERVQISRADLAGAQSGFGKEVDVSTTTGALTAIPLGVIYLLFAPFPWQLTNLRQSITLPEMIVWWASFPLLVLGVWFTVKHRLRQALPILIFTSMLTLAYSIFQGNVGTAYRQRSQLLVFYFIFVGVGYVLLREQKEEKQRQRLEARQAHLESTSSRAPHSALNLSP